MGNKKKMFGKPLSLAALLTASLAAAPAFAQTAPPAPATASAPAATTAPAASATQASPSTPAAPGTTPAPTAAAPSAPSGPTPLTVYGIQLNAQIDAGVTFNPAGPSDGINFGHLFTDRANDPVMNQLLLTAQHPIDPKSKTIDIGFDVQVLYGTDGRYTHYLGEFNYLTSTYYQLTLLTANVQMHLPYITQGGIDLKLGQYPTPLGYETIDPSTNPFYTHSYIFNFGLPFTHTGGYAVAHVSDVLDIYAGGDSGTNTTIGNGDNNSAPAALGGFNLTLMGGNLTILALTHIGPENPSSVVPGADGYMRAYNDAVITYKASDKLTLTTELNWARDAYGVKGSPANGFGIAGYASYALTDKLTLNGRAEVFRDDNGFFVAGYTSSLAAINALGGKPAVGVVSYGANTYTELTAGLTFKPTMPAPVANLLFRPEIRWDHAYGPAPFNSGTSNNQVTVAADMVLGF